MEAPAAHFVAVVDGAGPLVGGLVFGFGLVKFLVMALAWWAAPEGAPVPVRERILLGSQLGAGRR